MKQLTFDLLPTTPCVENKCLDPQPGGYFDCVENYLYPGEFSFFDGNEMEGHTLIMTIKSPNLNIEPFYDWDRKIWVWKKINEETLYRRNFYEHVNIYTNP